MYVYYALPLGPPSYPPSVPSRSLQSIELSSPCNTAGSHLLFDTWQWGCVCVCVCVNFILVTHPLSPLCPHVCSLRLCLYSCPGNRFVCTFFLDSTYRHWYMILVFLFLTYFTLYDSLWVHPHLYKWPSFVPFCGSHSQLMKWQATDFSLQRGRRKQAKLAFRANPSHCLFGP